MSLTTRCYRCLSLVLLAQTVLIEAPCGCEERYCPECVAPNLQSWLRFMAGRCLKQRSDRALDLAA